MHYLHVDAIMGRAVYCAISTSDVVSCMCHLQAGGAIASNAVTFAFLDSVLLMSGAGNPAATTAG